MNIDHFDGWLQTSGPVAVTICEELEPVQGAQSVFFPPTFAPPRGSEESPSYVVDPTSDGNVALIDSVGSQANRMEPVFKQPPYSELVPRASVRIGDREVDLLDAGHRAADAVFRYSDKATELRNAFAAVRDARDVRRLAKMAPTSLVFGVWDSRDTQVKMPRIVGATIRAYKVDRLTRAAQFFAAANKDEIESLGTQDFLSGVGLDDAPAGRTAGGVRAGGGIRREAVLNLIALRALAAGSDGDETKKVRRYILGLALVALLSPAERFLREGCLLVPSTAKPPEQKLVHRAGERVDLEVTDGGALAFAQAAARDFGVGPAWVAVFDRNSVQQSAEKKKEQKPKKSK